MTDFNNIDDLVARYLRRDLDAEELAAVDRRRQIDPAFAEAFETSRMAFVLREQLIANDLSQKMKHWRNDAPPPPDSFLKKYRYWFWAAFLLVCSSVAVWYFVQDAPEAPPATPPVQEKTQQTPPSDLPETPMAGGEKTKEVTPAAQPKSNSGRYAALAMRFYDQPDFNKNIRGNTPAPAAGPLEKVTAAMAAKNWAQALEAIGQLPPEYKSDGEYLKAHILFNQKKYNPAAAVFGGLKGSVRYGEAAQWYEIVALMPNYEKHKALVSQLLNAIVNDEGHTYQEEAKKLADALK